MNTITHPLVRIANWLKNVTDLSTPSRMLVLPHGDAHAVKILFDENNLNELGILLERKIKRKDVINGKLVPTVTEYTKKRGGKRHTGMVLELDTVESLHQALGQAIKLARKRKRDAELSKLLAALFLDRAMVAASAHFLQAPTHLKYKNRSS